MREIRQSGSEGGEAKAFPTLIIFGVNIRTQNNLSARRSVAHLRHRKEEKVNIIACIKQVPDTETQIRVKADGSGIDETGIKWVMNAYDEYGGEEGLRLTATQGAARHVSPAD